MNFETFEQQLRNAKDIKQINNALAAYLKDLKIST